MFTCCDADIPDIQEIRYYTGVEVDGAVRAGCSDFYIVITGTIPG
jgi:hypothetical protein